MIIKYKLESAFGGAASTDAVAMPKNNSSLTPLIPKITGDQTIEYKGVLLLRTDPAKTKTIGEAAAWYRSERNKIGDTLNKTKLSVPEKIELAEKLKAVLLESAAATLYDKKLALRLVEAFTEDSVEKISKKLAQTESGSVLRADILKQLTAPIDNTLKSFEYGGACFAAGTLVHTKEGLVPIEQIKVGDYVLSKPESGEGEQAYKRVTQTFAHAPTRVIKVLYIPDENQKSAYGKTYENISHPIVTTMNHPFWVVSQGWTAAEDVKGRWSGDHQLELCDSRQVKVSHTTKIYISGQPGVGWTPSHDISTAYPGSLWDYVNHRLVATEVPALKDFNDVIDYEEFEEGEDADSFFLKLPVYNLEVEDFHTYYVGKHGVWVHNKNGNGLEFTTNNRGQTTFPCSELSGVGRGEITYCKQVVKTLINQTTKIV